jgi:hypothetical protein
MLSAVPWPLWLVAICLFALPCSVIIPYIGLKVWERFIEPRWQQPNHILDDWD